MNQKAQFEVNPLAIGLGVLGGIFGVYMANSMYAGTGMKILVFIAVTAVCFFVSNLILNKE